MNDVDKNELGSIAGQLGVEMKLVDGEFVYTLADILNAIVDRLIALDRICIERRLENAESHSHSFGPND